MNAKTPSYHGYRFPPEIFSHAVWLYYRFSLSLREVEDLLAKRGVIDRSGQLWRASSSPLHGGKTELAANRWQPAAVDPCQRAGNLARIGTLARASPDGAITVGLRSGQAPDGFSDLVQDSLKALGLVDSSCCIGDSAELVEVVADAA